MGSWSSRLQRSASSVGGRYCTPLTLSRASHRSWRAPTRRAYERRLPLPQTACPPPGTASLRPSGRRAPLMASPPRSPPTSRRRRRRLPEARERQPRSGRWPSLDRPGTHAAHMRGPQRLRKSSRRGFQGRGRRPDRCSLQTPGSGSSLGRSSPGTPSPMSGATVSGSTAGRGSSSTPSRESQSSHSPLAGASTAVESSSHLQRIGGTSGPFRKPSGTQRSICSRQARSSSSARPPECETPSGCFPAMARQRPKVN